MAIFHCYVNQIHWLIYPCHIKPSPDSQAPHWWVFTWLLQQRQSKPCTWCYVRVAIVGPTNTWGIFLVWPTKGWSAMQICHACHADLPAADPSLLGLDMAWWFWPTHAQQDLPSSLWLAMPCRSQISQPVSDPPGNWRACSFFLQACHRFQQVGSSQKTRKKSMESSHVPWSPWHKKGQGWCLGHPTSLLPPKTEAGIALYLPATLRVRQEWLWQSWG